MKIKQSMGEQIFDIVNGLIMVVLVIITLYPLLYVLFVSFSVPGEYMRYGGNLLWRPLGFSLASYQEVFRNPNIWSGYRNTLFIVVVGLTFNMVFTISGAYVLSRPQLMLRRFLSLFTLFTMYFSGGMIPTYLNVRNLGLAGSIWSLIIPVSVNTFNLIIMRTAFEGVPQSLEESAKIDGASQLTILVRIMIPQVVPTMIYIRKRELYPLQLILREMIIQNSAAASMNLSAADDSAMIGETIKYATIVVATAPILCLYPLLQRFFVKGVMVGAVKG